MPKITPLISVSATGLLVLACTAIVASPAAAAPLDLPVTTPAELVQAITDTNANAGPDTIRVSGTLALKVDAPGISLDLPEITDDLTILGDGSATTTIDGGGYQQTISTRGTAADPISVDISGLTVTQRGGLGGAIDARYTNLTVNDVVTSDSYVGITVTEGDATVTNSTATDNLFAGVSLRSEDGGSVYSFAGMTLTENETPGLQAWLEGDARLTVTDSVSSGNDVGFGVYASDDTQVEFDGVEASGNSSYGIEMARLEGNARFALDHSTVQGNGSSGIRIAGDEQNGAAGVAVTIAATAISANGADSVDGGGIFIQNSNGMAITVTGTTISGNVGESGGGINAEVAEDSDLTMTIVNSTISGNTGSDVGGALFSVASGDGNQDVSGSHVAILNSTIVNNRVEAAGPAGVAILGGVPFEIRNTIIAGNLDATGFTGTHFGDLDVSSTPSGTIDYSLIQDPAHSADATITAGTGNRTGVDPELGPLADNGGPTPTHLLLEGSPAIDTGDPAFTGLTTDQRGLTRVVGVLDMGAVEIQAAVEPILAATGTDAALPLAGGAVLLLLTGGLLLLGRRRRTAR